MCQIHTKAVLHLRSRFAGSSANRPEPGRSPAAARVHATHRSRADARRRRGGHRAEASPAVSGRRVRWCRVGAACRRRGDRAGALGAVGRARPVGARRPRSRGHRAVRAAGRRPGRRPPSARPAAPTAPGNRGLEYATAPGDPGARPSAPGRGRLRRAGRPGRRVVSIAAPRRPALQRDRAWPSSRSVSATGWPVGQVVGPRRRAPAPRRPLAAAPTSTRPLFTSTGAARPVPAVAAVPRDWSPSRGRALECRRPDARLHSRGRAVRARVADGRPRPRTDARSSARRTPSVARLARRQRRVSPNRREGAPVSAQSSP